MKKLPILVLFVYASVVCFGQTDKLPVFKSTFYQKGLSKTAGRMEMQERPVQYLGPYKDTILLSRIDNWLTPIGDNKVPMDDSLERHYPRYDDVNLKIIFDPSKQVTLEEYEWTKKGYKYYKAYPILISNETDSTTIVGAGRNIPVLLEALDKDKKWKPIELKYIAECGVGLEYILLKPQDIVCVLAPIYTGKFKTKLRYRFGEALSKEFVGHISPSQFEYHGRF